MSYTRHVQSLMAYTECLNVISNLYHKLEKNSGVWKLHLNVSLIRHLCYNVNAIFIVLYTYGKTLICINILPFIFGKLYSTLCTSSTVVAP
jgi:hypothetical protein